MMNLIKSILRKPWNRLMTSPIVSVSTHGYLIVFGKWFEKINIKNTPIETVILRFLDWKYEHLLLMTGKPNAVWL